MEASLAAAFLRIGYRHRDRIYFNSHVYRCIAEMGICQAALHHPKRNVHHRGTHSSRPRSHAAANYEVGLAEFERNERLPRLFVCNTGRRFIGADFYSLDHVLSLCQKAAYSQGLEKAANVYQRSAHDIDLRFRNGGQSGVGILDAPKLWFLFMGHSNRRGRYGGDESFSGVSGGDRIFIRQTVSRFDGSVHLAEKKENEETIQAGRSENTG